VACWPMPTPSTSGPSTENSASNSATTPTAGARGRGGTPCTWGSCRRGDSNPYPTRRSRR
jgi:hypothetical protein